MNGEGRIRRGLRLVGQSMAFLRERPRMLALPVVSGILVTISAAIVMTAAIELDGDGGWRFVLVAAVGTFPLSALATFFNVAFVAMAADAVEGYEPTVRGGLRVAEDRLGAILGWTLLATGVGLLLAAVQQIPGVGGWVGRIVAAAGSLAWGLATFFVVPIIALHGTGARESVRRSASTVRGRWGEAVTGDFAIGAVMVLSILPAAAAIGLGAALWGDGDRAAGVPLVAAGVLIVAVAFTVSSALTSLFQFFLYRYVAYGTIDGPFAAEDLERAVKPKPAPFWRRLRR
jgi:hypothetical protein